MRRIVSVFGLLGFLFLVMACSIDEGFSHDFILDGSTGNTITTKEQEFDPASTKIYLTASISCNQEITPNDVQILVHLRCKEGATFEGSFPMVLTNANPRALSGTFERAGTECGNGVAVWWTSTSLLNPDLSLSVVIHGE